MFYSLGKKKSVQEKTASSEGNWIGGRYLKKLSALFAGSEEAVMRKYIRHPSDIPIDFQVEEDPSVVKYNVKDVSQGGLCFKTDKSMDKGAKIRIHIPTDYQIAPENKQEVSANEDSLFEAEGVVAWCHQEEKGFSVGVQFLDPDTKFGVRMVEQVCHIEHYRYDVFHAQGRNITSEQAAKEWVERYAAEFPAA